MKKDSCKQVQSQFWIKFVIKNNYFYALWQRLKIKFNVKVMFNGSLFGLIHYLSLLCNSRTLLKIAKLDSLLYFMNNFLCEDNLMRTIIFLTKVSFLMRCNIVTKETYTVSCKKEKIFHLQLEVEVLFQNVPIYQWSFKEMSLHY